MKDKLIEILNETFAEQYEKRGLLTAPHTADHLLTNGVIVPPCKVGDTVYRLKKRKGIWEILPREVVSITHRLDHLYRLVWEIFTTEQDRLGKTVFLTKEEAEAALAERSGE